MSSSDTEVEQTTITLLLVTLIQFQVDRPSCLSRAKNGNSASAVSLHPNVCALGLWVFPKSVQTITERKQESQEERKKGERRQDATGKT